ncbi:MAG: TatD family hydrolase [Candidatus Binataceae bacterium]
MTSLIDTHCHLADERLDRDLDAIMRRARAANVKCVVAVGAMRTIDGDRRTVEIAEEFPETYAAVGVHPHDASVCDSARLAALRNLARSKRVVAIGETGLDFHYNHSPHDAQERALLEQLKLADELSLPIVIHCRDAEHRLVEIVRGVGIPRAGGAIHSFTGDVSSARELVELGFYISFSGIVTFKSAGKLRDAAKVVPDDRIMVETDAPYLAPEPYRGRTNEPANVGRTLEVVAAARGVDVAALGARIMRNASELFRIDLRT